MVLFLQCISVIFIYTIIVLAKCKDPVQFYSDYPPKIKERIKALPMYKDKIPTSEKTYGVKIIGTAFLVLVLYLMCYFADKLTFSRAFLQVFIITMAVDLYDVLVLDLIWFCHSKYFVLPGTEDLKEEYKSPITHIKGGLKGLLASIVISCVVGIIIRVIH